MSLQDTRRKRLKLLMDDEFDGKQQLLANHIGVEQNYISSLLGRGRTKKSFGEKAARRIETHCGKPEGWLDNDGTGTPPPVAAWPFDFDPALWDRLHGSQKRELAAAFTRMVLGASVEQAATASSKKRAS